MELTREEMLKVGYGSDYKRLNVFVGESITDINDPEQRKLVLDEVKRSKEAIDNGDYEIIAVY